MNNLTKRKPLRLKGYNYSRNGAYFVTICTADRRRLLGKIFVGDAHRGVPHMELSEIGEIVQQYIETINVIYPDIDVDKYIIMPNHLHIIIVISQEASNGGTPRCASPTKSTLAKVINAFKSLTTRRFGESLWQRSYYDHIIRNEDDYLQKWQYIDENPAKWAEDEYCNE